MQPTFSFALLTFALFVSSPLSAQQSEPSQKNETIRIGIIGLDTSHVLAFTKSFNQEPAAEDMQNCRVVAAYPHGSRDIESSRSRIPKYTEAVKELGVEIVDSIDELLSKVDCVLLETNDGKPHLEQALQVFRAGKPVFIDKPTGSKLSEVVAIFRAAKQHDVPMFSSSSLRFSDGPQHIRSGGAGDVLGCATHSPCSLEPSHVDLYWYGIHGVEILFTCMGPGCVSVSHTTAKDSELAVGVWEDGRIGTFRGMRDTKIGYGGTVFGKKGNTSVGKFDGYQPLCRQIAKFFRTKKTPIDPKETIEIYAYMQAAAESKKLGGQHVKIADVMARAEAEADELLNAK